MSTIVVNMGYLLIRGNDNIKHYICICSQRVIMRPKKIFVSYYIKFQNRVVVVFLGFFWFFYLTIRVICYRLLIIRFFWNLVF